MVEGTDLSLGHGSLGGDLASFRVTGQEIGQEDSAHTLDTGQAPTGVTLEDAPRLKAFDWRQLKRFGILENRVPKGFEILLPPAYSLGTVSWRNPDRHWRLGPPTASDFILAE